MSDDITKAQESMSDALDNSILASLASDECTAADRNVARQRLKDLGISSMSRPGDTIDQITAAVFADAPDNVLELPMLSDDPNAVELKEFAG